MGYFDRVDDRITVSLHILYTTNQETEGSQDRLTVSHTTSCLSRPSGDVPCSSKAMACGYWFSKWQTTKWLKYLNFAGSRPCEISEALIRQTMLGMMHQSILAAPSRRPPSPLLVYCRAFSALSVPGVGHLQILRCPEASHLPTVGPTPSFWHARGFLSEYNYTKDFTWKTSRLAH